MIKLNPYLNFGDNCEEAFNFYKSVFGGEFTFIGKFGDMPGEMAVNESEANKIMHVSLPVGDVDLMGSDTPSEFSSPNPGNNISVSVNVDSVDEANRIFNALSDGGDILIPIDKSFFAQAFGMFVDKFGIRWMVNCQ